MTFTTAWEAATPNLAATQIEALASDYDIAVIRHPLTSSALMDARSQNPFHGEPASGQYDWDYRQRDAEEWAALYGVPFIEPTGRLTFDRVLPALACLAARRMGAVVAYSHEVFRLMFVRPGEEVVRDDYLDAADLDREAFAATLEAVEPVIPGDPGFVFGPQGLDGALGEGELELCDAFCGGFFHAPIIA